MKAFLLAIWEVAEVVLVAAVTVFVVRTFLAQPFLVSGASMEPNFSSGNYLLVDEITYRFREPQRGEVVIFRPPGNPSVYYIKRIIGLPTERVLINNGEVHLFTKEHPEGFVLNEHYLEASLKMENTLDVTLDKGQYFVMGDNRDFSYDSRSWGPLPEKNLLGLVRLRLLPVTEAQVYNNAPLLFEAQ
ncbi:MAG: signal peptidase I [Candidatus Pacebacteria bacterium]|nr:signal peptidase I [Candidatus Paceibacterota bacterium]